MSTRIRLSAVAALAAMVALGLAADSAPTGKPLDTSFLKQYAATRGFMLGRPQKPKVSPDGKTVLFLRADPPTPKLKLFEFNIGTGKTRELLSPEKILKGADEALSPEEKARRERMRVTAGGFADFHLDPAGKRILVLLSGKLYLFDRSTSKVLELKTGPGPIVDPKWSPDGTKVSYVRGFDVAVYDLDADTETMATSGGTRVKTHGLAEFVAQEEMGRFTGYWWSPDSKSIAYEEADNTGVERWYVADPFRPGQEPAEQFYPRPGKKNAKVRLGIVPVAGGETVWMKWPEQLDAPPAEYLVRVVWDKYGPLTVSLQDRLQQEVGIYAVEPKDGGTKRLFALRAKQPAEWISLDQVDVHWTKLGIAAFLGHGIDVLSRAGDQQTRVMRLCGDFPYPQALPFFDPDTQSGLLQASWYPDRMHVYRLFALAIIKEEPEQPDKPMIPVIRLSSGPGVHTGSGNRDVTIVTSTTPKTMLVTRVLGDLGAVRDHKPGTVAEGTLPLTYPLYIYPHGRPFPVPNREKVAEELPSTAAEPGFIPNVQFLPDPAEPKVEIFGGRVKPEFPKDDQFFAAIVRPRDFDPKKKYPVIVDVYGGPKHLHVVQAMRNWLIPQWIADQGFIVVAIDNRGTPGRGLAWESAVYQKFGTVPIDDQVKGLHALCDKFPELDRDRVGIFGWSFGGYNAANGVLRRPDVFKAAVAGAPVTDWEDYDSHYTERYMGLLPASKAAYEDASLIPLAKDLKRPLLLVHGTADDNVYFRHTLNLANALLRAGKEFEVLPLPGITHMVSADPVVMERFYMRTSAFFKQHLGEPK